MADHLTHSSPLHSYPQLLGQREQQRRDEEDSKRLANAPRKADLEAVLRDDVGMLAQGSREASQATVCPTPCSALPLSCVRAHACVLERGRVGQRSEIAVHPAVALTRGYVAFLVRCRPLYDCLKVWMRAPGLGVSKGGTLQYAGGALKFEY